MANKRSAEETTEESVQHAPVFTKHQFLSSNKFTPLQKDELNVLLKEGKLYTNEQVESLLKDFAEKEVK